MSIMKSILVVFVASSVLLFGCDKQKEEKDEAVKPKIDIKQQNKNNNVQVNQQTTNNDVKNRDHHH